MSKSRKPKTAEANPPGRPSVYTKELGIAICARLSHGESLKKICGDAQMPGVTTVFRWLSDERFAEFRNLYEEARVAGLEVMADEIMEISDEEVGKTLTGATDSGAVQKQRLRVDTRKWLLSKLLPKKYGERQTVEHEGGISLIVATGIPDDSKAD